MGNQLTDKVSIFNDPLQGVSLSIQRIDEKDGEGCPCNKSTDHKENIPEKQQVLQ